jgi:DNA modification methylase
VTPVKGAARLELSWVGKEVRPRLEPRVLLEDTTSESRELFGPANAFEHPKPEKLIATLIGAVTDVDYWVLDSFAGSGPTVAVASKMGATDRGGGSWSTARRTRFRV